MDNKKLANQIVGMIGDRYGDNEKQTILEGWVNYFNSENIQDHDAQFNKFISIMENRVKNGSIYLGAPMRGDWSLLGKMFLARKKENSDIALIANMTLMYLRLKNANVLPMALIMSHEQASTLREIASISNDTDHLIINGTTINIVATDLWSSNIEPYQVSNDNPEFAKHDLAVFISHYTN